MKTLWGFSVRMLLVFLLSLIFISCGSSGGGNPPPDTSIYVDAVSGSDTNAGTSAAPFQTITHALSVATVTSNTIRVRPGTYDTALGETFPLILQAGQILIGDEANKGNGTIATFINGRGAVGATGYYAAIIGAEGSRVSGFKIDHDYVAMGFGVYSFGVTMTVSKSTFGIKMYGGVALSNAGNPVIENNVFETSAYGVYSACSGTALIQDNAFSGGIIAMDTNIGNSIIQRNTFAGGNIISIMVQNGAPRIEHNTFTAASSSGIVYLQNTASPVLRGNTFSVTAATGAAVYITNSCTGLPDLGTAASPGNNVFTIGANGLDVYLDTANITVQAQGNTWSTTPVSCGFDINVTGFGSVVWGAGVSDKCST